MRPPPHAPTHSRLGARPSIGLEVAARRARASEANFQRLFLRSSDGLVIIGRDRIVRCANPAAEAILGVPGGQLVGTPFELRAAGGGDGEVLVPRRGRRGVPVRITSVPLEGDGEPRFLVSLVDLRGRKRGERIAAARAIQRAFLPRRRSLTAGPLEASGSNEHCQDASGDFYDFVDLRGERLGVAIGDVAGHGLGAALVMAQGRAFVRAYWQARRGLREAIRGLNESMLEAPFADVPQGRFIALLLAEVDLRSGRLSWCNAGHVPGLLLRAATGEVERLPATAPPVGVVAGARFPMGPAVRLEPGDLLLLTTDGVTEAPRAGRDRFGEERLVGTRRGLRGSSPDRVLAGVRAAVASWTGGRALQDDVTLVALRWNGKSRNGGRSTS